MSKLTFKDFKSGTEIRWCPGCGDLAILNAVQKTMASLDVEHKDYAVISGIGCSSRFPYYMSTYGFHTIHGRASAIASGVKASNPKLSVWQITGDGDALAIGGNHFIHMIRRNININVILFNNKIYGLTKGQYSPTCDRGKVTKSSPFGTVEDPFSPGQLVLGSRGQFFARSIDGNMKMSQAVFTEAAKHEGTSIVEVLQNCVIFNDGIHKAITKGDKKADHQIYLEDGKPMLFGEGYDKGLRLDKKGKLEVVTIGENGVTEDDILIHDAKEVNTYMHSQLIEMTIPEYPVAFGVIRSVDAPVYDVEMEAQLEEVQGKAKNKTLDDLFLSGNTWTVE